jgi:hypothetical protein
MRDPLNTMTCSKVSPRAGGEAQVVEHLPCKCKALSSNPSTSKVREREIERERERAQNARHQEY